MKWKICNRFINTIFVQVNRVLNTKEGTGLKIIYIYLSCVYDIYQIWGIYDKSCVHHFGWWFVLFWIIMGFSWPWFGPSKHHLKWANHKIFCFTNFTFVHFVIFWSLICHVRSFVETNGKGQFVHHIREWIKSTFVPENGEKLPDQVGLDLINSNLKWLTFNK